MTSRTSGAPPGPDPFVALMRRYVVDYTNRHDLAVCDEILEPDYVLRMGPHVLRGRDAAYKPATRRQLEQFPGLGLTVHDVVTDGRRLALRFSEHGASVRHGGAVAAWRGLGLYSWNGTRLTENRVEQDYLGRRRQLDGEGPDPVDAPAPAPWDTVAHPADPRAEEVVRAWARAGLPAVDGLRVDDGRPGAADPVVDATEVEIDDLFSAGDRVAVHAAVHGTFRGPRPGLDGAVGTPAVLHLAALVTVRGDRVVDGHVVRDRLGLARAMRAGEPARPTGAAP